LAICLEGLEDVVCGLGPDVGSGVLVPEFDPVPDVGFEGLDALVGPALEQFGGQLTEPAFHHVEPGRAGGDEVHVEPGVGGQPFLDDVGFVGGVVVADDVHVELGRHRLVDGEEELAVLG
jgi:hypothetical protein